MTKKKDIFKQNLYDKIVKLFDKNNHKEYTLQEILNLIKSYDRRSNVYINKILNKLLKKNIIKLTKKKYKSNISIENKKFAEIRFTKSSFAFLLMENESDIKVSYKDTLNTFDGDIVYYEKKINSKGKPRAIITSIKQRKTKFFIGRVEKNKNNVFVVIDDKRIHTDFFIDKKHTNNAKNNDKVLVEFIDWPNNVSSPFGKIVEIYGKSGDFDVELNSLIAKNGLDSGFNEKVMIELDSIDETINSNDPNRLDMRNITTFTIDPFDAKDFDDALSIEYIQDKGYKIGIHIADVSHYVKKNSEIDIEAYKRGTSVYLADRVIPMLPEKLSNFLCSLRPNEDKNTFSVVFDFDFDFNITNTWYGKTLINSNKRFDYNEAQNIIDNNNGEYLNELLLLNKIAKHYRKIRLNNGSLDIESNDIRFKFDENNYPSEIYLKSTIDTNKLIEEFMLLANRSVSMYLSNQLNNIPNIYRVHDVPSLERLSELSLILEDYGIDLSINNPEKVSFELNKILQKSKNDINFEIISKLIIRTMAKAEYSPKNIGHYGLKFDFYTHFTSPIRRYPDLTIHRILQSVLTNTINYKNDYSIECKHYNQRESIAVVAERESIKLMQIYYLNSKINKEFDATVTSIKQFGFFIELIDNKTDSLIIKENIDFDSFVYDIDKNIFKGKQTKKIIKIGTKIRVKLIDVNLIDKTLVLDVKSIL